MDTMTTRKDRQPRAAKRPADRAYPQSGTNAMRVLVFIRENPGTSTNNVITKLGLNPTIARKCITALLDHQKIEDNQNAQGHHSYSVKGRL